MNDLVSIITPLYNAELFITETMHSVMNQTYKNWEWIIVNDKSTDKSVEVVSRIAANDSRIKIIHNQVNMKTARTRNAGIEQARGRYIAFIDSDDLWVPQKLEKQINFMKGKSIPFSFHGYKKFWGDLEVVGSFIEVPENVNYDDLLRTNSIACLSAMYDQFELGKVFMPDGYKAREDFLCWLQILKKTKYAYGMNEALGYYRIVNTSYSSNKKEVAFLQWKLYREFEKLNLLKSMLSFCFYSLHGLLKKKKV